tara:strand:- start:1751 stop:2428 length:678 start_codon:yes stop_codon:yes gene_type:complete
MAKTDNSLYNSMVGHINVGSDIQSDKIFDVCSSIGEVINNLGVRLKNKTLKELDSIKNTSGELRQSYDFRVKVFGESFEVQIYLADYYDYVNQGVKGSAQAKFKNDYIDVISKKGNKYKKLDVDKKGKPKKISWIKHDIKSDYSFKSKRPPLLREWLNNKGLKNYNPFAVQESMFARGIKGKHFWDRVVDDATNGEINRELIKDLVNAGATGYSDGMNEIFDDLK